MEQKTHAREDSETYMVLEETGGPVGYWDINQGC